MAVVQRKRGECIAQQSPSRSRQEMATSTTGEMVIHIAAAEVVAHANGVQAMARVRHAHDQERQGGFDER